MDNGTRPASLTMEAAGERHVVSLLVRFWLEPREIDAPSPLRGYVRHLQTGEVQYVSDPQMIVDYVLRELGEDVAAELRTIDAEPRTE